MTSVQVRTIEAYYNKSTTLIEHTKYSNRTLRILTVTTKDLLQQYRSNHVFPIQYKTSLKVTGLAMWDNIGITGLLHDIEALQLNLVSLCYFNAVACVTSAVKG